MTNVTFVLGAEETENCPSTGGSPSVALCGTVKVTATSGTTYDSTTGVDVLLVGQLAPNPMPRLAKAVQISPRSAPPLSTVSAVKIPSRACKNVGLFGEWVMPSVTSCNASWFPTA